MLKFQNIKIGDFFMADNDGDVLKGEVTDLKYGTPHQVLLDIGVQEFWYDMDQLSAIPLSDEALADLKFSKLVNNDGTVKYSKGAFRIMLPAESDFTAMEIWYRDEKRHILATIAVHELQNHFLDMTKVHLNEAAF
jgi:hypothetical protein